MTADVVQRAGCRVGVLVVRPGRGLVHRRRRSRWRARPRPGRAASERGRRGRGEPGRPSTRRARPPTGGHTHPAVSSARSSGCGDQQRQPGDRHDDRRHPCPALRLAGEATRQHGEHRPAAGEGEQGRAGDDVLGGAAEDAERQHDRLRRSRRRANRRRLARSGSRREFVRRRAAVGLVVRRDDRRGRLDRRASVWWMVFMVRSPSLMVIAWFGQLPGRGDPRAAELARDTRRGMRDRGDGRSGDVGGVDHAELGRSAGRVVDEPDEPAAVGVARSQSHR